MSILFYTKLSKYYDKIYHYVSYKRQAKFFSKLYNKYCGSETKKVLDVACGTGTHDMLLQKLGFQVSGLDKSKEMILQARKKSKRIRFIQGDMRKFSLPEKFDMILCYFSAILYNKNQKEFMQTLKQFKKHLKPKGLIVFDIVTKQNFINEEKWKNIYKSRKLKIVFESQARYNSLTKCGEFRNTYTFFTGKRKKVLRDVHEMGAFTLPEIKQFLRKLGLKFYCFNKEYSVPKELTEKERAVFVCRK